MCIKVVKRKQKFGGVIMLKDIIFKRLSLVLFLLYVIATLCRGEIPFFNVLHYSLLIMAYGSLLFSIYNKSIENKRINIVECIGVSIYLLAVIISFCGYSYWYYSVTFMVLSCLVMYFAYNKRLNVS